MAHQRREIGLRSARKQQRGLEAEERRGPLLQAIDGRVVAEDVVADLGLGHGAAHALRRTRNGV
jgi:hypothetical protein